MIIGTAGHIDHGKSALVQALTGRRMDRLAEERRRGITIELNFAPLLFEGGPPVGIVDVPGHEDFVRTMVAGASGIDLLLLVVDAQEGIMPQTLEHLAVAEQLGIASGIPVLTKADLVEPSWLDLVRDDLATRLADSPIAFEEVQVASAATGEGIAALRDRLFRRAAAWEPGPRQAEPLRLPVDRVFSLPGAGTVVTGTVWAGLVRPGDQVRLSPGDVAARVRSVECFGQPAAAALPGSRAAIALVGPDRAAVVRGQALVGREDSWQVTEVVDVVLSLLPDAPRALSPRTRIRFHHGTAEVIGRVYPSRDIQPGEAGPARLVLDAPVLVRGEDRFVIRSYSPVRTIGGGWVADPCPPRRAEWPQGLDSLDRASRLVALVGRRRDGLPASHLPQVVGVADALGARLVAESTALLPVGERVALVRWLEEAEASMLAGVAGHHERFPASPGPSLETLRSELKPRAWLADAALDRLAGRGALERAGGAVRLPGFAPRSGGGEGEVVSLIAAIDAAGLEGATREQLRERLDLSDLDGALRVARDRGAIEPVEQDRYVGRQSLDRLGGLLRELAGAGVEISPASLRDRLGLSRKYLIPLLEWSDRAGLTRRTPTGERTVIS